MKKVSPVIASERSYIVEKEKSIPVSEYYGEDTFSYKVMQKTSERNLQEINGYYS